MSACSVRKIRYWKDDGKSGDLQDYYRYNARDCWATLCSLLGILHDCPDWAITNYVEHEFPVVFPAIHCEVRGIKVDKERFDDVWKENKGLEDDRNTLRTMVARRNSIRIRLNKFRPYSRCWVVDL